MRQHLTPSIESSVVSEFTAVQPSGQGVSPELKRVSREWRAKNAAENEAQKSERNARRWKAERDPKAYERQKQKQRAEYAAQVAEADGRDVRGYSRIEGKTPAARQKERLARDASRKTESRAQASQDAKDREADRKWSKRKEKAGWTPDQIAEGLAQRIRLRKFESKVAYEDDPNFGAF